MNEHDCLRRWRKRLAVTGRVRTLLLASVLAQGVLPAWADTPQITQRTSPQASTSLKLAFEAAWQRQPQARSADERRNELAARATAAKSLVRGAPALGVENWSDRWTQSEGFAKYATELALPMWLPGEQGKTQASIAAEQTHFESVLSALRLKLAGEVRELYWAAHLASNDVAVAALRVEELQRLAQDLQRRERAGALARVDAQTAQAQVQLALSQLAQAQSAAFRAQRAFEQVTGFTQLPPILAPQPIVRSEPTSASTAEPTTDLTLHPVWQSVQLAVNASRKQYELAAGTLRDNPELGVGLFRERGTALNSFENIVTLRLRIPFATQNRNQPRLSAANAAWIEAQTLAEQEQARLHAGLASAQDELETAKKTVGWAHTRRELARDNQQLISRAFDLGERDLATRLRAQTEFFDAELSAQRATTEWHRAADRVQHALGLLP